MVRANKIRINKYKSEYIIKLVGVYICQMWHLMVDRISSKMGNINEETIRINYINVNHLVQLYDVLIELIHIWQAHMYHIDVLMLIILSLWELIKIRSSYMDWIFDPYTISVYGSICINDDHLCILITKWDP